MNEIEINESYGTLSETINGLIKLGYSHDFNIVDESVVFHKANMALSPDEFQIDQVYRFDGDSDPDYQSILYAISSLKYDVKGTLVNGYGISSDEANSKLVEKLTTNNANNTTENQSYDTNLHQNDAKIVEAHLVQMNLNEFMKKFKNNRSRANSDRNSFTIFKSQGMRIVIIGLRKNAELKPHKANGIISIQVVEGKIDFTAEQQTTTLEKGQMIALQENVTHSVKAIKESCFLLTLAMNNKNSSEKKRHY